MGAVVHSGGIEEARRRPIVKWSNAVVIPKLLEIASVALKNYAVCIGVGTFFSRITGEKQRD